MNRRYDDILSRIAERPAWWQSGGVPRFQRFEPGPTSTGVYTCEVALADIACQACGRRFIVAVESARHDFAIKSAIQDGSFGYGDPPAHDHCGGETMQTVSLRVLEYWTRNGGCGDAGWRRDPSLEGPFDISWWTEASD